MKSVGTLRKKGLGGVDQYIKKDKSKNSSASSPVSTATGSQHASPKSGMSSSTTTAGGVATTLPVAKPVQQAPITVDLHRFADDNLQPEDCRINQRWSSELKLTLFLL